MSILPQQLSKSLLRDMLVVATAVAVAQLESQLLVSIRIPHGPTWSHMVPFEFI